MDEQKVWEVIDTRCCKWQFVYDFKNPKGKRLKILEELLEEEFKKRGGG